MSRFAALVCAVLACAAASRGASGDVLVELGSGDQVTGSFAPVGEVEQYVVRLCAGAKLTASVAGKFVKHVGPVPAMELVDPHGAAVAPSPVVATTTGAKIAGFVIPESGAYTLRLTSATAGDYSLKVKWSAPTTLTQTINFGITPTVEIPFHTPPGTIATARIAALAFQPGFPLVSHIGSSNGSFDFTPPPPPPNWPVMSVKSLLLGGTSPDYSVTVTEYGNLGSVLFTLTLAPPKTKARKVDVTSHAVGDDPAGAFVQGGLLGPDGGTLTAGGFAGDPIAGASLTVPPGALKSTGVLVLGPATELAHAAGLVPRGPAVSVGPSSVTFLEPATVTLPYEKGAFGPGQPGLQVLVRDKKGKVTTLVPPTVTVDDGAGTVSFPTLRAGSFQVFGPGQ